MLRKKLNVFTSHAHSEMTPGNKRLHFEHARSLKANLKVNIFGDGLAANLTTGRDIDKEIVDGLLHVQKTLGTNISGLFPRAG